ncbi:septation protein SepH [Williamsia sterculiae]|uniref:DUF3071 domain-containing protein n=1 Tax=Williamsia sterculiae TaxID=1344003 RepID=A0A1N7GVX4_9NOCA|nr:septation protein SepH [Williamsia sterculiae]SIS16588.1 Protein of unknown function [Williamsia sterculiae]
MRELRVVGVEPDAGHVVLQDIESGEKFRIEADDRLRAAARGDRSRLGQIEIEMDSTLRPRDIQARIRAGASIAQVASAAGVPASRIERFAHPVLLERRRVAELAALAHPVRHDGPTLENLSEVVTAAFVARGHNPDDTVWDAWKGDDNRWIVQIGWRIGRSQNFAHFRYLPGSHGGTVEAIDEFADELIDPDVSRPLQSVAAVAPLRAESTPDHPELDFITVEADEVIDGQRARHEAEEPTPSLPAPDKPRPTKHSRSKPQVPAWEDVLLGVRSNGNT